MFRLVSLSSLYFLLSYYTTTTSYSSAFVITPTQQQQILSSISTQLQTSHDRRSLVRTFVSSIPHTNDVKGGQEQEGSQHGRPKITSITSPEEYLDFLEQDDRLCIIKFYASWCKSCQKMGLQYQRVARKLGDIQSKDGTITKTGVMRFAEVEYSAAAKLCKKLNIKKLPTVIFYSQGQRVDGFPSGPAKFPQLLEKISTYTKMTKEELAFEAKMNEGMVLGQSLLVADLNNDEQHGEIDFYNDDDEQHGEIDFDPLPPSSSPSSLSATPTHTTTTTTATTSSTIDDNVEMKQKRRRRSLWPFPRRQKNQ